MNPSSMRLFERGDSDLSDFSKFIAIVGAMCPEPQNLGLSTDRAFRQACRQGIRAVLDMLSTAMNRHA
jgi:hypothetical protein